MSLIAVAPFKPSMKTRFYPISNKSLAELGVASTKELWEKVKAEHEGLSVGVKTQFVRVKDANGEDSDKFSVVMSTANQDRHGDIVMQEWELDNFTKNPVLLDSHNYYSIEHILGRVLNPRLEDGKLKGDVEFFMQNPRGVLAYEAVKSGFTNAVSVGFIPKAFDNDGNILKSELLELSLVSVPANAEALFEKGIEEAIADVKLPEEETETVETPVEVESEEEIEEEQQKPEKSLVAKIHDEITRTSDRQKSLLLEILKGVNDSGSPEKKTRKLLSKIRDLV